MRYGIRRSGRITVTRVAASASTVRTLVASIGVVPFATLPVPKRMPGSFFASATSSAIDLTPSEGCEASTIG